MDKATFLETLQVARADWEALLDELDANQMTLPVAPGEWSVTDIIAHVTWHEREMVGVLRARALVGSDLWNLPVDERNAVIYEQNRHRSLDDVRAEAEMVFQQLLEGLQSISDEDLVDPGRFRDMPPEWQPWKIIADNSFDHYRDHGAQIRAWRDRQRGT